MNRSPLAILIAFMLLAVIGYSGIWFFHAQKLKISLRHSLEEASLPTRWHANFKAGGVRISGFPFAYDIEMDIEEISFAPPPSPYSKRDLSHMTLLPNMPLKMSVGVFSRNHVKVELPASYDISINSYTPPLEWSFEFVKPPKLDIHLKDARQAGYMLLQGDIASIMPGVVSIDASLPSMQLIARPQRRILASLGQVDASFASIYDKQGGGMFKLHGGNISFSKSFYQEVYGIYNMDEHAIPHPFTEYMILQNRQLGSMSVNIEGDMYFSQDITEAKIKQIAFVTDLFFLNSDGNLTFHGDGTAHGWYRLQISNYAPYINALVNLYNISNFDYSQLRRTDEGIKAELAIDDEMIDKLILLVENIADEIKEEDALMLFKREEGAQEWSVGRIAYSEFLVLVEHLFTERSGRGRTRSEETDSNVPQDDSPSDEDSARPQQPYILEETTITPEEAR